MTSLIVLKAALSILNILMMPEESDEVGSDN